MSSNIEVDSTVLKPMQRLFMPPRGMDEATQRSALGEYFDALRGYDNEDLQAAWRTVRDAHKTRSWPAPGAFVAAARDARKARSPEKGNGERPAFEGPDEDARWRTWQQIKTADIAKQAAREGWAWSLKCRVLDGTIQHESDINAAQFQSDLRRAEETARAIEERRSVYNRFPNRISEFVSFDEENRARTLKLYERLLIQRDQAAREVLSA